LAADSDLVARLEQLRRALEAGLITQEEFDVARAKAIGI
jgi:predicted RNA-binding protein associated with RNAse of E/G family